MATDNLMKKNRQTLLYTNNPIKSSGEMLAFGLERIDRTIIMTTDPKKAKLAGWPCLGILSEAGGQLTLTPRAISSRSERAISSSEKLEVTRVDLYSEITARTASLTNNALEDVCLGFVGAGAQINTIKAAARTGVRRFHIWDKDHVDIPNVGRTAYDLPDVDDNKTTAAHRSILNINPDAYVAEHHGNFLEIPESELEGQVAECDALVVGTDSQDCQLGANSIGYRLGKPMIFPGFYERADGGEIVVVVPPGPCYRCQARSRFEDDKGEPSAHEDLPGESGLIFDCDHVDSLVGKLILTLLLESKTEMFTHIFQHVRENSLIFVKNAPDFLLAGEDIFGQFFGNNGLAFMYQTLWMNPSAWRIKECPICGSGQAAPAQ